MKKIEFSIATNRNGSKCKEIMEFEDDATEKDIEEYYLLWLGENNYGGWQEVSDE